MKKRKLIRGSVLLLLSIFTFSSSFGQGGGQTNADISLNSPGFSSSYYGTFPGYGISDTFNFIFANNSFNEIVPNAVKIIVAFPAGTGMDTVNIVAPNGWAFVASNDQWNGYFINTDTIPGFDPMNDVSFQIPMYLDGYTTGNPQITISAEFFPPAGLAYHDNVPTNNNIHADITIANVSLPVDFASFDAKAAGCAVALNWVTSREENNDYFVVERSQDGRYFAKVGSVKALSGEDVGNREYSFVDEHPFQGNNFYRIRQMDINGKSTTTSVEKVQLSCDFNGDIAIYPNPTRGIVYVKGLADAESIEVFNVLGQRVLTQKIKQGTEVLDISNLADGNYHLRVIRNQESIFSAKIVKK